MHHYYHFYKPVGCVSARKDAEHTTVMDYFPSALRETLFPLGRLDKNTEGLLLITDDGKLNHRMLDPENNIEETPHTPATKCALWLTEGKRHQVKRMFEAVGCTVVWLRRTEFAGIALDETLSPGEYRPLNAEERTLLGVK